MYLPNSVSLEDAQRVIGAGIDKAQEIGRNAELKEYDGAPHGLIVTHAEQLNKDLLPFLNG